MKKINYYDKEINLIYSVDTVVVGGGTAGAVAAISSAKSGNKTLVVEKHISLGGTQTNALVTPMMPTYVDNFEINTLIVKELEKLGCNTDDKKSKCSWFNVENLVYVLEKLILKYNAEILYDANLVDVIKEEDRIKYIIVNTIEGLVAIEGKNFVDATGDALLSRLSKVKVVSGDENGNNQMVSFRFEVGGIDVDKLRKYMKSLGDTFCTLEEGEFYEIAMVRDKGFVLEPIFKKALSEGVLIEEDLRYFQGFTIPNKRNCMSFNCPHIPGVNNNTDAITRSKAVIKGREMINRLINFMKLYLPGFEEAFLLREASALGVRESYRILGEYILNEEDYLNRARFEDGIARGDWYIDVHSVTNKSGKEYRYEKGEYYEIPYRCLITKDVRNLIVVGRCISSTFLVQASIRIQPTLRDLGEIAGEACAYSIKNNIDLNKINGKVFRKFR
ncbi:FAD-dependent oxidoreductase [Clostridium tertium]|uniref:Ribulose-1,5-biphosphate synthetase n=1 Tax=Clostridium tertium TaxID=1559 RepID=A0A6N3GUJ4_9CLOT